MELSVRIFCDSIPENMNKDETAIYCFAHHKINIPIMSRALSYHDMNYPVYILENKTPMSGVSCFEDNKELYKERNINVKPIPYDEDWINTKIECHAILSFFIERNIKNVILVAPAFHIERAVMTCISSLIDKGKERDVHIFSKAASIDNWNDDTISHQGNTECSFFDMVLLEKERIAKYTQKGDILSVAKIMEYLCWRT
jgi:hypothetical protein